ncbi:hypothetical protein HOLleu_44181 [Holothuria leucospilota]|uniref:Uncharacterized protein n=1 Tax=Holothuria leucospilota TaxID=206669 RepID=A0A9Q0YG49_HOLLE|nr:hypothetical protein HOLleu_44181 [Holothuria leucospilota]
MIDSGALCNIIDMDTWTQLKERKIQCKSEKVNKTLYPYGKSDPLDIIGKFSTYVYAGNIKAENVEFFVMNGAGQALLGKETAEKLKLLAIGYNVNKVDGKQTEESELQVQLDDPKKEFPECFNGVGKLKGYRAKLHIDPETKPVAQKARRIPFGLRDKLDKKLDELLSKDIIEEVKGPTTWVTVQSPEGVTYKRNSSHVKKFESGREVTPQVESSEEGSKSEASGGIADDVGIKSSRPVRTHKMPSRFKNFVIDTK